MIGDAPLLFDAWAGIARVFIMTIAAYVGLIVILRIVGKRSLAKLNIFDFVVTIALGSTLASILLSSDIALAEGLLAFVMLAGLQWLVARLSIAAAPFRRAVRSDPRLLLRDGAFHEQAMHDERVTHAEVEAEIRKHGFADIEDIAAVVLESDGTFSVIARDKAETRSALRSVPDPGQ